MKKKMKTKRKLWSLIQPPALRPHLTVTLWQEWLNKKRGGKKMFKTFKTIFLAALLWLMAVDLSAQAPAVPHLINFQSILADAAGLPLADGLYDVDFKIVDADGSLLYQETQKLETVSGVASAMVGAQGEMDLAKLEPTRTKFLEVEVIGRSPARRMEIVTVPYSLYAEQSLGVVPKGVGTEAIQTGAITKELLSEELLNELLSGASTPAKQVDVETNFLYSRGPTVQTVLQDLDTAIHQRQVNMERLRTDVNGRVDAEETTRSTTDTQLQGQINTATTSIGSVSANLDVTKSRVDGVENKVNQLFSQPRVAAAGVVNGSGSLAWGYHVSSASPLPDATIRVNLEQVSYPYFVLVTPVGGIVSTGGIVGTSVISNTASTYFEVATASPGGFHFVVFK